MTEETTQQKYMSIAQVAKRFGKHHRTVRRWIAEGRLAAKRNRVNKATYVLADSVADMEERELADPEPGQFPPREEDLENIPAVDKPVDISGQVGTNDPASPPAPPTTLVPARPETPPTKPSRPHASAKRVESDIDRDLWG